MESYKFIINHLGRPVYDKFRGFDRKAVFENKVNGMIYSDLSTNLEYQKDRLSDLLDYAIVHVPYYQNVAKERGIKIDRSDPISTLSQFPILTKNIIRDCASELVSELPREGVYENTSGGSTGEPVKFWQDKKYRDENPELIFYGFTGYGFGDKRVYLWGSERDILAGGVGWKRRIIDKFYYRQQTLNSFRMSENDMDRFCRTINRFAPSYMVAYAQSAYEFAKYIEFKNIKLHRMKGIITAASTLYDDFREKIENVFGCPVFNNYGSREVGTIAMECENHNGLHQNIFNQFIEIIDEAGITTANNERRGGVIITNLSNYVMPLIRYEIGDRAVSTNVICGCGRGLPLIKKVTGRTVNVFRTRNSTLVDGEYFTHLFYGINGIKKFQVIQWQYDKIEIKYVPIDVNAHEIMIGLYDDIRRKIALVMGKDCKVFFSEQKDIEPTGSGKFMYTISYV
jgi:phenylacetate-CoA ligase